MGYRDQVILGVNTMCTVLSVDTSNPAANTITCSMIKQQDGWADTQPLYVVGRLIEQSTCAAGAVCTFTYAAALQPTVTVPSTTTTYSWGDTVTLTGSLLSASSSASIKLDFGTGAFPYSATSLSGNSFTFTIPELQADTYPIRVKVSPYGDAAETFNLAIALSISPSTFTSYSTNGAEVPLTGSGLNATRAVHFPPGDSSARYCIDSRCVTLSFRGSAAFTPVYSPTYDPAAPNTVLLTKSNVPAGYLIQKVLISLKDSANPKAAAAYQHVACTFQEGSAVQLSCPLLQGIWAIEVWGNYGLATTSDLTVSAPEISFSQANYDLGMGGGQFTVDLGVHRQFGSLSPITVCGRNLLMSSAEGSSLATVTVPAYASRATLATYPQGDPAPLPGIESADIPAESASAFDNKTLTYYESTNTACFLQLDLTASDDLEAKIAELQVYPNYKLLRPVEQFEGALLEYSSDGSLWTTAQTLGGEFHSGWNSYKQEPPLYARYVRFSHTSASKCGLSEFSVSGHVLSKTTATTVGDVSCPFKLKSDIVNKTYTNTLTYKAASTPKVTQFSP